MSTASPSQSHATSDTDERIECECDYCDDTFWKDEGYNSDFCSYECRSLGAAEGLLNSLQRDHTRCSSCFRELKIVYPPRSQREGPVSVKEQVSPGTPDFCTYHSDKRVGGRVGEEEGLPGYVWGIGESFASTDPVNDDFESRVVGEDSTKVCQCGVTHHATVNFGGRDNFRDNLSKRELTVRCQRLIEFAETESEWCINHDATFEKLRGLKQELSNKGADWEILKYALAYGFRQFGK